MYIYSYSYICLWSSTYDPKSGERNRRDFLVVFFFEKRRKEKEAKKEGEKKTSHPTNNASEGVLLMGV